MHRLVERHRPWTRLGYGCLSLILLLTGLWAIALQFRAPGEPIPEVAQILGSPVRPDTPYRNEQNALGGGDFATFSPGGWVAVRFARPYRFSTIRHVYSNPELAFPWVRVTAAKVQWSDDGQAWTDADIGPGFGGTFYFNVEAAGAHAWWRFIPTGWAGRPDLTLGNLWFTLADAPFVLPFDVAWALLGAGMIGLLAALTMLTAPRALALTIIASAGFVLSYALLTPSFVVSFADSGSYVQPLVSGTYDAVRSAGYPLFVTMTHRAVGLANIGTVQLALQLAALGMLVFVVARCYGIGVGLPIAVASFLFFSGTLVLNAPFVLTEALFTTGFLLAAAGLVGSVRRPGMAMFILAGAGLALATVAKSTGIALAAAAALPLIRFLPKGRRLRGSALIFAPTVLVYLALSAHMYAREKIFAPEAVTGIVLAGHVAWLLGGDLPERPGIIGELREGVYGGLMHKDFNPSTWKIRSFVELDRYVDENAYSITNNLHLVMIPALLRRYPQMSRAEMNSVFTRISLASISTHPLWYAEHVTAHFYGMWRQAGRAWTDLRFGAVGSRSVIDLNFREGPFLQLLGPLPADERNKAARSQGYVPLASAGLLDYVAPRLRNYFVRYIERLGGWAKGRGLIAAAVGILALALCVLLFVPGHLAVAYRAEVVIAFLLNGFMLSHALVVAALERYAAPAIPIVFVFVCCVAVTTWRTFVSRNTGDAVAGAPACSAQEQTR